MRMTHIVAHHDRGPWPFPWQHPVTLLFCQDLVNQPPSWFSHFTPNLRDGHSSNMCTECLTVLGTEDTLLCKTHQVLALKELEFQLERKTVKKINK